MALHLFLVHFPVSLLLFGVLVDLAGLVLNDPALRYRGGQLIIAGGVAAFLGFATGEGAKMIALNAPEIDIARIATHEQWGSAGAWALLGIAILRTMWRNRLDGTFGWINLALGLAGTALVLGITITGTLVRHAI